MKKFAFLTGFFIANTLLIYSLLLNSSCQSKSVKKNSSVDQLAASPQGLLVEQDLQLITNKRQITFVGPRAGEGYFNSDGSKLIFQSERFAGNPFYQIYSLDLKTGKTDLISTGQGKTTCSWFHPNGQWALFSSTHLDPGLQKKQEEEFAIRKSAQKAKYAWSYDEYFDIFAKDLKTNKLKRLTTEKGYDAEGSYSPDGQWIAFASNRTGYTEKLSEEEQKLFAQDPSYMMEIYIMKADGTQVKRLTEHRGYDGGPFFSADGKKITWRRFAPNGQWAEIWTMNMDGSEQKQLTHWKAMSWAPYFHPSGDYIIFTSNRLGYSNFELYLVDTEGKKEPVRASFLPDFDGLPVFSPDGEKLSWTHRNASGESQIYLADWNDKKARELLGLQPKLELRHSDFSPEIREQDIRKVVQYLASDEMAGRQTGGDAEKKYTEKIAKLFSQMGLRPYQGESFLVPFEFTSDVVLGGKNRLEVQVNETTLNLKSSEDYLPLAMSLQGEFKADKIAFAGYGIVAPASDKEESYDSYKNIDVKDKWVLIFRDIPENIANSKRIHLNMFSRIEHKVLVAKQRGAKGVLVVLGPNAGTQQKLMKLKYQGGVSEGSIPVINISNEVADKILKATGRTLKQWQDVHDQGEVQTTDIAKVSISGHVDLEFKKSKGLNVVGLLQVPGARENLVIGAHGDHLGRGEFGSSLAKNEEQGQIHTGADDNASGVSGVIELAHHYAHMQKNGKLNSNKNLVFAIWSGEEIGLLGSTHWLSQAEKVKHNIFGYINLDMIGRLRENLMIQGVGSAKEWRGVFESLAGASPVSIVLQEDPYTPSDSMAFYMKNIPSVMFFTGAHAEYHTPRDRAETINYTGIKQVLSVVGATVDRLSQQSTVRLSYLKTESSRTQLQGRSFRVYLGTIPDYSQEGVKGVKISGTSKDSPAEKAGLKTGDVIIELSGLKIENLYDYVYGLQSLKANQPTKIRVVREGKTQDLSITPMMKE